MQAPGGPIVEHVHWCSSLVADLDTFVGGIVVKESV